MKKKKKKVGLLSELVAAIKATHTSEETRWEDEEEEMEAVERGDGRGSG